MKKFFILHWNNDVPMKPALVKDYNDNPAEFTTKEAAYAHMLDAGPEVGYYYKVIKITI